MDPNETISPQEFIKERLGTEITEDNESFDCDLEWSMICDLMVLYAQTVNKK